MPANKKYLTKSAWTKFSKILAGSLGGYLVTISFHAALTRIFLPKDVIITSFITGYLLWAVLLLFAFLIRQAWKTWALYTVLTVVFAGIYYLPI
ncbi:hypothetical protein DJ568_14995 [Mucilaginibacter hurinus]|uniref:Iron transporter n=1 Tax=Mucilaginibacter hurinus TaxID=2201324 RepID=A0A367GLF2_9SPHI|nr:hypothetical protein [Mucilaginibacter hurinus]RCH53845.1 hypothetical protein DJ568_14995 [Mucilaginibacter hurinus]